MIKVRGLNIHKFFIINHIGPTPPPDPWEGQIWLDTSNNNLICKIYKNNKWEKLQISWDQVIQTPSTLAGYGITDSYTKEEVQQLLNQLKEEVISAAKGLNPKEYVTVATTENINLNNPPSIIDGITLQNGNRILVKNQSNAAENGIYVYNNQSLTRAPDADTWDKIKGAYVWVQKGHQNRGTSWFAVVPDQGVIGETPITFIKFSEDTLSQISGIGFLVKTETGDIQLRILQASPKITILNNSGEGHPYFDINESVISINNLSGVLSPEKGGTGLSTLGNPNQIISVNSLGNALEYRNLEGTPENIDISYDNNTIKFKLSPTIKISRLVLTDDSNPLELTTTQKITNLNADLLDGFHASITPQPFTIPVADQSGKISDQWINSSNTIPNGYSRFYAGTTFPDNPIPGSLFWNTQFSKLFTYKNESWIEIDWIQPVQQTKEWKEGYLRINSSNNKLEISPDKSSWFECIPLVGASCFKIETIDNNNYSLKFFLPHQCEAHFSNINHIPIVFVGSLLPQFEFMMDNFMGLSTANNLIGIRPNGVAISNGLYQMGGWRSGTTTAGYNSGFSLVFINILVAFNSVVSGKIFIFNSHYKIISIAHGSSDLTICGGQGTGPSNTYWLGTFYSHTNSSQYSVSHLWIRRCN